MTRKYRRFALMCAVASLLMASAFSRNKTTFVPKEGFVPDEVTAIAIAEAVLKPIYGVEQIESERPYHAKLVSGVWWIGGTLPRGRVGGVAVIRISKRDGRVLSVTHGQ